METETKVAATEQQHMPPSIFHALWDKRAARILFTALIFAVALFFLYAARETLVLFLFAILFAYFLEPLVGRLERPMRGRGKAILVVYAGLILLLVGLGFLVGPKVAEQGRALASSLPSLLERFSSGELVDELGRKYHLSVHILQQVRDFLNAHKTDLAAYGKIIAVKVAEPAQHIWWLVLIPILSLFFLKEGKEMAQNIVELGDSAEAKDMIEGLLEDVNVMLGSYIRSQLILSALTLAAYTLVLSLMRVPFAFVLGPAAGVLEFIPVVGPAIAAVSIVIIAISAGYSHVLWLILFLGVWRLFQDYVSAPRIMGKSLEIEPVMQIFAVLAGGEIGGVVGALISVPVVATLRIIWKRIKSNHDSQEGQL